MLGQTGNVSLRFSRACQACQLPATGDDRIAPPTTLARVALANHPELRDDDDDAVMEVEAPVAAAIVVDDGGGANTRDAPSRERGMIPKQNRVVAAGGFAALNAASTHRGGPHAARAEASGRAGSDDSDSPRGTDADDEGSGRERLADQSGTTRARRREREEEVEEEEANWAREAEESAVRLKVENALKHIRSGDVVKAKETFEEVLGEKLRHEREESAAGVAGGAKKKQKAWGESSKTINQLRFVAARNLAKLLEEESKSLAAANDREGKPSADQHQAVLRLRQRALDLYVDAVGFDAQDVVVWHRLGTLALESGNLVLARFAFTRGLAISPNHHLLVGKHFDLCKRLGDVENATESAKRVLRVNSGHKMARLWIHHQKSRSQGGKDAEDAGAVDETANNKEILDQGEHIDRLFPVEEVRVECLQAQDMSIAELLEALAVLWEENNKNKGHFSYVRLEYHEEGKGKASASKDGAGSSAPVDMETDAPRDGEAVAKETKEEAEAVGRGPGNGETAEKAPEVPSEGANRAPPAAGGKDPKRKRPEDEKSEGADQPARRSRRVRTLQMEKEERAKNEIQKVSEQIVTITAPGVYKSHLEERMSPLDKTLATFHTKTDARVLESAKNATKVPEREEREFLCDFSKKHGKPQGVGATIISLVNALAAGDSPKALALLLQTERFHLALARALPALRDTNRGMGTGEGLGMEGTMIVMEMVLDRLMEERQKKTAYSSRRARILAAAANAAHKQKVEAFGALEPAIKWLADRMSTSLLLFAPRGSDLITRYYWNQGRFLRLAKKKTKKQEECIRQLKLILTPPHAAQAGGKEAGDVPKSDGGTANPAGPELHLPWCKNENKISSALVEQITICSGNTVDTALQRCKILYKEDKASAVVEELTKALVEKDTHLPLEKQDVLEDKTNHSALILLMDAAQKVSWDESKGEGEDQAPSRVDLLCALRLLLAVFVSVPDSEEGSTGSQGGLPSPLSAHVRRAVTALGRVMCASALLDAQGFWKVASEIQFTKTCFKGLALRCYRDLFLKHKTTSSSKAANARLENPHSCRNQLIDASMGFLAMSQLQLAMALSKMDLSPGGDGRVKAKALVADAVACFACLYDMAVDVQAQGIRDAAFLDFALHQLKILRDFALIDQDQDLHQGGEVPGSSEPESLVASVDSVMRKMIFSMYGVNLGLDCGKRILDFPGDASFASRRACRDVWHAIQSFAQANEAEVHTLEGCLKGMLKHYLQLPGELRGKDFLGEMVGEVSEALEDRERLLGILAVREEKRTAAMTLIPREDASIFASLFRLVVESQPEDSVLESCKVYAGHAITADGHGDIRREAALYANHLVMNPTDAEGWLNFGAFLDQSKDLIQNDAAKLIPATSAPSQRQVKEGKKKPLREDNIAIVKVLRDRIRACLLVAYGLLTDKDEDSLKESILDLLSLCMYDAVQNVPPEYDQVSDPTNSQTQKACAFAFLLP